jgi:two-component system response regulator DevR
VTVEVMPAPPRRHASSPLPVVGLVVVERRPVYRAGVRAAVEAASGVAVVAEVAEVRDALDVVARHRPGVVLIGLDTGGLRLCRAVTARFPGCRVVILGPPADGAAVVGAVRAGARGYLRATAGSAEYPVVIRAVGRGRTAFDPASAAVVRRFLAEENTRDDRLTPRELDVLRLADSGLSTPEIAARLQLSGTTVKSYLGNVMRKLGVTRRAGAVYVGRERGLI